MREPYSHNVQCVIEPVAVVRSPRRDRRDDRWGAVESTIELVEAFSADSLVGLEAFSHLEVVFLFHAIGEDEVERTARRPRENPAWPLVGIFAQRGAKRPNRIGVSRCELIRIEGRSLRVRGLDAIDGTPVLDIKPYMREFEARGEVKQPAWASEVMADDYTD